MGDPQIPTEPQNQPTEPASPFSERISLFGTPAAEPSNRGKSIGAATAIVVVALLAAVFFLRGSKSVAPVAQNILLPPDPYGSKLVFSQMAMSESTSLSGGKSTFIDGHVQNTGSDTLTSVTVQVVFRNDIGLSPQVETLPLALIRTHEPYVDTEAVSADPLKPGDDREFRLIIETVNGNWNQQMPGLAVVRVSKR